MAEGGQSKRIVWFLKTLVGLGTIVGLTLTAWQAWEAKRQYVETSRQSRYEDILAGLSATSPPATQVNAIFRLVEFVHDSKNFDGTDIQRRTGGDLQQTLVMYIRSTARSTSNGLGPYRGPGISLALASIALRKLQALVSDRTFAKYAIASIDLDTIDLHGFHGDNTTVRTNTSLVNADLREAQLSGIRVTAPLDLSQADLTCADLNNSSTRDANLGHTDLTYADLTGADLRHADLRHVQGLTPAQVQHTTFDATTRWPAGFRPPPSDPLTRVTHLCTYVVNRMTGMLPGEGYSSAEPWPAPSSANSALAVAAVRAGCTNPNISDVPADVMRDQTGANVARLLTSCRPAG